MCGIAGFFTADLPVDADSRLDSMSRAIAHRGPDGAGTWSNPAAGVGVAHRRLAILDLSDAGSQPMLSAGGRFVLVFNGEIYNFLELRAELEKANYPFASRSDTEVMLAAFATWGVQRAVSRFRGMFAFALWDASDDSLYLARDALGKKPLYVGRTPGGFVFGSELRALWAWSGKPGPLDPGGVRSLLEFGYVRAPLAICAGVEKIRPGELCRLTRRVGEVAVTSRHIFWSARAQARPVLAADRLDADEAALQLENHLAEAVRLRMVADVPLGVFLSGGIDSTLVAALMQSHASSPVRAYTVGFDDERFDEAPAAAAIANVLGLQHEVFMVAEREVMDQVPGLPLVYDEPFADASQIPTTLLCRLARKHVTVALSGDGGDESFAGYNRYLIGARVSRISRTLPRPLLGVLAHAARALSPRSLAWFAGVLNRRRVTVDQAQKLMRALATSDLGDMYGSVIRAWPAAPMAGKLPSLAALPAITSVSDMMLADLEGYLPDDVLVKVDRASMHAGLEVRSPLLDLEVVRFAASLPLQMHMNRGAGKCLLRRVLSRHVSPTLWDRPKRGFTPPIGEWLRGPLREWAESLLGPVIAGHDEWLDPSAIDRVWTEHLTGRRDAHARLWPVLMFRAWREEMRIR